MKIIEAMLPRLSFVSYRNENQQLVEVSLIGHREILRGHLVLWDFNGGRHEVWEEIVEKIRYEGYYLR
jgi:hypothetical protein